MCEQTPVLCNPTDFFPGINNHFKSLQASFNCTMVHRPDKYHLWGTPTELYSQFKKTGIPVLVENVYR